MRSLLLLILLMPIFAFAEIVTVRSGNFIEVINLDKSNHVQARMYAKYEKNGQLWKGDVSKRLRMGLPAGAMTNTSVPVVLEHQVTKKAVMRSVFEKVVTVAKNPLGKSNFWTAAAGFAAVYLIDEFFLKDGEYVAVENSYFVIFENGKYSGIGEGGGFDSVKSYQYFC